jgi:surface carbohydrate biosynthesis protein (TIGR04326 family)
MDNLDQSELRKGNYVSKYWGSLSESLRNSNTKVNYLHLFVKDHLIKNTKDALRAVRIFNSSSKNMQTHMPLASFLNTTIILRTIISWIRLARKARSIYQQIDYSMTHEIGPWALFIDDWRESFYGQTAMLNILNASLFSAAFSSIKKQRFGVYLQENQGYEFLLISKWREFSHGTLIGCPHIPVRFWDLRYFFDPRTFIDEDTLRLPLPDKVALNGRCAVDLFVDWGYPYKDIVEVEALRFEYLALEFAKPHGEDTKYGADIQRSINALVLGEVDRVKTVSQLEMLQRAMLEVDLKINFVFRAHPNCPVDLAQYPGLKITLTGKSLLEDLLISDVVVCGSATSSVVDAACVGKKIISLLDSTNVNASPLRNSPNIAFVTSERQLADALQNFQALPIVNFDITKMFTIDPSLPRWKALLKF